MGRKSSNTAEYFMHDSRPGKTIFILEKRWGNDGYAFWFKLLEVLSSSEGHFFPYRISENQIFFDAKMGFPTQKSTEILDMLAALGNIDPTLWREHGIIWCQNLVNRLAETLYKKREHAAPTKPIVIGDIVSPEIPSQDDSLPGNENNECKNRITGETIARRKEGREGRKEAKSPPLSASPAQEEPQEKSVEKSRHLVDDLRKINHRVELTAAEEDAVQSLAIVHGHDVVVETYRIRFKDRPRDPFAWFISYFDEWRKKVPKQAEPSPPRPPAKTPEEERAELQAEIAAEGPDAERRAQLAGFAVKRKMHIRLTEEEEKEELHLLAEQDQVAGGEGPPAADSEPEVSAAAMVEQDDIPF